MKQLIYFFISLGLFLFHSSCDDKEDEPTSLLLNGLEYSGDYIRSLPLFYPDSCLKRIENEVPPRLYWKAFEAILYNAEESTPDSIMLRYLDLFEHTSAEIDTIMVFTKAFRGKILLRQNRFDTAMSCLKQAEVLGHKIQSLQRISEVKTHIGELYARQGNYPEAVKSLLEAYNIRLALPVSVHDGSLFELMIDIGNTYRSANDFVSAQIWHFQAWRFACNNKALVGFNTRASAAVADNYLHLNQLDSAKMMIDTAFYYQNRYQYNYDEAERYHTLAQILLAQGKCKDALSNFWKAKQKNLKLADPIRVNHFNQGLGDGYFCLGRLDSAIWFFKQALATPDTARQAKIHEQLGKIYAKQGRYDLAYQEKQESQSLFDKVFTTEKDKTIGRLQASNELEKRERQIEAEISQNKLTRLWMVSGLLALSLGLILGLFWVYKKKREWQSAKQEKELIEAREQLKTQALLVAEHKLMLKERALEESNKQLDLKDLLLQELQMRLTVDEMEKTTQLQNTELQSLKILTTEDWRRFRNIFEQRFPNFLSSLKSEFPKLTDAEIRLLMLIKIGFDAFEVANILGITSASVYTNRYRLRKKLGLIEEELEVFVQRF